MEWLVLLSCIIVIEFVKNSRNLLVYFDFTSFVLRFEKTFKSRKAPRTFLRPLRRPCLENPKGSHWSCLPTKSCAMRAMCAIRTSRASPHRAQATSFYELSSSFVQSFAWVSDGLLALQSLKISQVSTKQLQNGWKLNSDLRVIHHQ